MTFVFIILGGILVLGIIALAAIISSRLDEAKDWAVIATDGLRSPPMTKKEAQQTAWVTGGSIAYIKDFVKNAK